MKKFINIKNDTKLVPRVEQYHIDIEVVNQMMCYDSTLTHYLLDALEMDIMTIEKLILTYRLGAPRRNTAVLWRMNSRGEPINGNTITYDEQGEVRDCHRIFSQETDILHDYNFGTALFGGHLLGDARYRHKKIALVYDELTALLGAEVFPDLLWLALGHKQNLTAEHLNLLCDRTTILYPDDMAFDPWKEISSPFPNVMVSDFFTTRDANKYFIGIIRKETSSDSCPDSSRRLLSSA